MGKTITIQIPEELDKRLKQISVIRGISIESVIVRNLESSLSDEEELQPFMELAGCLELEPDLSQRRGFQS